MTRSHPADIILCATQRCGSTMIVEDMRNTGVLGQPEEWFIPWDPAKPRIDWQVELQAVRNRATGPNGVMSVKIMANQLHHINRCLAPDDNTGPPFPYVFNAFRSATWVWLRRNDTIAQAVSRTMAQQTGINHATAGEDHFAGNLITGDARHTYNANTTYNRTAILRECTAIARENQRWGRFFGAFNIRPLTLLHEDVITDANMTHLDRIAREIDLTTPLRKTRRRMVKIGNHRNRVFSEQFRKDITSPDPTGP